MRFVASSDFSISTLIFADAFDGVDLDGVSAASSSGTLYWYDGNNSIKCHNVVDVQCVVGHEKIA